MTTELNRHVLREITSAMEKAFESVGEEYGITIKYSGGNFNVSNANLKFEIAVVGENGEAKSRYATDFESACHRYGMKKTDIGRTFTSSYEQYEIVGCKPKCYKAPIIGKRVRDGKLFKFPVDMVVATLSSEEVGRAVKASGKSAKKKAVKKTSRRKS